MGDIFKRASAILEPYRGAQAAPGVPDPSFVLQLADEVYFGSNLYAVQKTFEGEFQFDVFFESASAKQKLTCKSCSGSKFTSHHVDGPVLQPRRSITESRP